MKKLLLKRTEERRSLQTTILNFTSGSALALVTAYLTHSAYSIRRFDVGTNSGVLIN